MAAKLNLIGNNDFATVVYMGSANGSFKGENSRYSMDR